MLQFQYSLYCSRRRVHPVNPMCTIEFKNTSNRKAISRFRAPRAIKSASRANCVDALFSFRFSSIPRRSAKRKWESEKERKRHPRRRPQSSSYWFIGITERPARPDPARPGPRSRVATSIPEGWKRASVPLGVPGTGSGSLPGHWLFMKPRSELRDTTERYPG